MDLQALQVRYNQKDMSGEQKLKGMKKARITEKGKRRNSSSSSNALGMQKNCGEKPQEQRLYFE